MKCVSFALLWGVIVIVGAYPKAENKPAGADDLTVPLADILTKAQASITEFSNNIQKQLNIDQTSVVETLKNQSNALVTNVQTYFNTVSEEVKAKAPEFEKVWADVKTKISKVADDINAQVPNAQESAQNLQKQFTEGVQTLVKEFGTIAEGFKQNSGQVKEEIATFTKKVVDTAVQATENLNKQLQSAAAQPAKN